MVLKELIFNILYLGRVWWSTQRTDLLTFYTLGGCDGHERNDF